MTSDKKERRKTRIFEKGKVDPSHFSDYNAVAQYRRQSRSQTAF